VRAESDLPIKERVIEIVQQHLAKRGLYRPIEPDDDLSEAGMSSLDLVNLMLRVEA